MLLWTKSCLKWSPYKVKGAFSTPICARKQTNGPPGIDHRAFLQVATMAAMHGQPEQFTHPPPPVPPQLSHDIWTFACLSGSSLRRTHAVSQYPTIPASSAPAERTFSAAVVPSGKRNRLSDKILDSEVFIK